MRFCTPPAGSDLAVSSALCFDKWYLFQGLDQWILCEVLERELKPTSRPFCRWEQLQRKLDSITNYPNEYSRSSYEDLSEAYLCLGSPQNSLDTVEGVLFLCKYVHWRQSQGARRISVGSSWYSSFLKHAYSQLQSNKVTLSWCDFPYHSRWLAAGLRLSHYLCKAVKVSEFSLLISVTRLPRVFWPIYI